MELDTQTKARPMLGKELGQIKTLYKLYEPGVLFNILVKFFLETETYTKHAPNLGLLLLVKDNVYRDVLHVVKVDSKSWMRSKKEDAGDF